MTVVDIVPAFMKYSNACATAFPAHATEIIENHHNFLKELLKQAMPPYNEPASKLFKWVDHMLAAVADPTLVPLRICQACTLKPPHPAVAKCQDRFVCTSDINRLLQRGKCREKDVTWIKKHSANIKIWAAVTIITKLNFRTNH